MKKFLLLLLLLMIPVVHGVDVTLNYTHILGDTYTDSFNSNSNFGDSIYWNLGHGGNPGDSYLRGFIKFNLSSIPTNANINDSKIYLTLSDQFVGGGYDNSLEITAYGNDDVDDWYENNITWNNQPSYDVSLSGSTIGEPFGSSQFTVDYWNVTEIVNQTFNNDKTEVTIFFVASTPDSNYKFRRYYSINNSFIQYAPILNISYVNPPIGTGTSNFTPTQPLTSDTIEFWCNIDYYQTPIDYNWTLYKNGTFNTSGTVTGVTAGVNTNLYNLSNANTTTGENWTFGCAGHYVGDQGVFFNTSVVIHSNVTLAAFDSDGLSLNNTNFTVTGVGSYFSGASNNVSIRLPPGSYSATANTLNEGYVDNTVSFNLTTQDFYQANFTLDNFFIFNFIDEKTLDPFNMSSPSEMKFAVLCSAATYIYDVNVTPFNATIPCNWIKFRFLIAYDTSVYARNLILSPTSDPISVYLIDLANTQGIYSSFKVDDLMNEYDNPSIWFFKYVNDTKSQIHADFVDIEDKVGATLIENDLYNVEVCSDNRPCREMGIYTADTTDVKILKLYDIGTFPTYDGFTSTVTYNAWANNDTGSLLAYGIYNDSQGQTTSVTFTLTLDETGGPLIYTDTTTDQSKLWTFDISAFESDTVVAEMVITYGGETYEFARTIHSPPGVTLPIMQYVSTTFMNWFITLLIGAIALLATIRTSNLMSMFVWGLAALFTYFRWYGMSWSILALVIMVSLMSFLKKEDTRTDKG